MLLCYSLDARDSSGKGRLVRKNQPEANATTRVMKFGPKLKVLLFAKRFIEADEEIVISPGGMVSIRF
jgi:hypothetical protein